MSESLKRVAPRRAPRRVAMVIAFVVALVVLLLVAVPWRQSVAGTGEVIVFDAMDRPQNVEALIPGRLVEWTVQEGQDVESGTPIAKIEDIDSKFLDPRLTERLKEQREFAQTGQEQAEGRAASLRDQKAQLEQARVDALGVARQAIAQAEAKRRGSAQSVRSAEASLRIAREVAVGSASERAGQAKDRITQAEQSVRASEAQAETMRLRRVRLASLFKEGLRSKQDDEFAENDLVKARTEVVRARQSLAIARRDLSVGTLAQSGAGLEIGRAEAAVESARASLDVAERDVLNAKLNLSRLQSDTAASIAKIGADVQSALESVAKNSGEVRKVENDLGNLEVRTGQQIVRAPRTGRVVRLLKVGEGATVKAGDVLATIAPNTTDRAVELYLTDNDVPLVAKGRPVRLQFAGWPAVQLGGIPGASVGTFGGRVAFIDPVDDGKARYRVVIREDRQRLPGGRLDAPWPDSGRLRPGAEAFGWVMLDTVPLGFELWRQANAFPPKMPVQKKDPTLGPVKLRGGK